MKTELGKALWRFRGALKISSRLSVRGFELLLLDGIENGMDYIECRSIVVGEVLPDLCAGERNFFIERIMYYWLAEKRIHEK
jgi:hypothetical protein